MRARLPVANTAQALDCIPEEMDVPADTPVQPHEDTDDTAADDTQDTLPYEEEDFQEIDSLQYDYPWPTSVNSATGLQHLLSSEVTCPFCYRSLHE
jgi:hypothetical protein